MHGKKYNWNAHSMVPPGIKAKIYKAPQNQRSWGPCGIDTWCCEPALDHYRNYHFYIPTIKSYCIPGSLDLFPQHCLLLELIQTQHAIAVKEELIKANQQLPQTKKQQRLHNLANIFKPLMREGEHPTAEVVPIPAITPQVTLTNTLMALTQLMKLTLTHNRITHQSQPGMVPTIPTTQPAY